jgi:type I restriction enzyme, S subunit
VNKRRAFFGRDLPDSWELAAIGDVAKVVGGSTPKSKEPSYWDGPIPWLAVSDLTGYRDQYISGGARSITQAGYDSCATQLLPAGAVIFSSRAPIGYVAIAARDLCTSQGFKSFVPTDAVSSEYLYWYLQAARPLIEQLASGTTFKEISGRAAKTIPVPIPPRAEQDRIVAAIDACMNDLDAALRSVKAAVFGGAALNRSVLERSVAEGEVTAVGDVLAKVEAGKSFRCQSRSASFDEWGVIKVSAMTWGAFQEGENKAVLPGTEVDARWEIEPGDLLLSRANTSVYVGASVLVRECRPRLLLSDKSLRLRPADGVASAWLHAALSAPSTRAQISDMATGTKDSMRNISQAKLRQIRIRVPSAEVQRAIVAEIDRQLQSLGQATVELTEAQEQAVSLRRAILTRATTGRLVPQDRANEPASELLRRIREEPMEAETAPEAIAT